MAASGQYLRIVMAGMDFLLPGSASIAIEQRDSLIEGGDRSSQAVAWRESKGSRWPAYHLDENLRPTGSDDWLRAVFLNAHPNPVGLAANEIQLMPRTDVQVETFHPPGPPHSSHGHLFSAAWVKGNDVMLVFDPEALSGYLAGLEKGR